MSNDNSNIQSRLLKRQVRKFLGDLTSEEIQKIQRFIRSVDQEYADFKGLREMLEGTIDQNSHELSQKNIQLSGLLEKNLGVNKKLENSRSHLKSIIDNLGEGLIVVGADRNIIEVNYKAELLSGVKAHSLIGKPYNQTINFVSSRIKGSAEDFIEKTLQHEKEYHIDRDIVLEGIDKKIPIFVTLSPVRNYSSEGTACIIVFRDATKERELDEMQNEFLSVASHELRTPMTVIKGYVSLFLGGRLGAINEKQRGFLTKILANTTNLIEMVNDMLDVNKLESGQLDFLYESLDITRLVSDVVSEMSGLFEKKQLKIEKDLDQIECFGDSYKIKQILMNLLSNAYKFTSAGGEICICLKQNSKKELFIISVVDSGRGIHEEDLNRLFQKFSQIGSHLNKTEKGTGLGLSICKKIAEGMGGSIGVKSEHGEGSTFFVELPLRNKK